MRNYWKTAAAKLQPLRIQQKPQWKQAIAEAQIRQEIEQVEDDYTEVNVTDEMTDLLLDDVIDSVFEELESVLGKF